MKLPFIFEHFISECNKSLSNEFYLIAEYNKNHDVKNIFSFKLTYMKKQTARYSNLSPFRKAFFKKGVRLPHEGDLCIEQGFPFSYCGPLNCSYDCNSGLELLENNSFIIKKQG